MAKRSKGHPGGPEAAAADLELFASFVRSEERKERDAKKAARDERRQADELTRLIKVKEDAAAEVKRLRARDGASAEQKAAADEAYKAALAAVVAAETGEAPAWAPPPTEVEVEVEEAPATDAEGAADDTVEPTDEAAGDDTAEAGDGEPAPETDAPAE